MDRSQCQVREFHKAFNYQTSPAEPKIRSGELRANLIIEEAIETVIAFVGTARAQTIVQHHLQDQLQKAVQARETEPNLERAIDGLCDLKYVTDGSFEDIGVDGSIFFDEVHRSNMAKVGGPVNEHGKQLKPPGWTPPDIAGLLGRVRRSCGRCGGSGVVLIPGLWCEMTCMDCVGVGHFNDVELKDARRCGKCGGCGSLSVPGELHDTTCSECDGTGTDARR